MTLKLGIIGQGSVPVTNGVIFTAERETIISSFTLYSSVAANTIVVWLRKKGNTLAHRMVQTILDAGESYQVVDVRALALAIGDSIEAGQTGATGNAVFNLSGAVRT